MVMIGSALMSNLRRIHRYLVDHNRPSKAEKAAEERAESVHAQPAFPFSSPFQVFLRSIFRFQPARAGQF
jgi:ABC-type transport system involved in Fe-S cluster assembly fused permease/ATPase subunit